MEPHGLQPENSAPLDALTPAQIAHWRKVLAVTLGPYALIMPNDQIQRIRDAMQKRYGDERSPGNEERAGVRI